MIASYTSFASIRPPFPPAAPRSFPKRRLSLPPSPTKKSLIFQTKKRRRKERERRRSAFVRSPPAAASFSREPPPAAARYQKIISLWTWHRQKSTALLCAATQKPGQAMGRGRRRRGVSNEMRVVCCVAWSVGGSPPSPVFLLFPLVFTGSFVRPPLR